MPLPVGEADFDPRPGTSDFARPPKGGAPLVPVQSRFIPTHPPCSSQIVTPRVGSGSFDFRSISPGAQPGDQRHAVPTHPAVRQNPDSSDGFASPPVSFIRLEIAPEVALNR